MKPSIRTPLISIAAVIACAASASAGNLEGETVTATNYHGTQPNQTQIASASAVVGPGTELPVFGFGYFVNGQQQPGVYNINFSDDNITITLNANMPFSYFQAIIFSDTNNAIAPFSGVTINPATNFNGFNASNLYVSPGGGYIEIFPPQTGLAGQIISLDLVDPCPADAAAPANGVVNVADLLSVVNAWGACAFPADCTADANNDGMVNAEDLLTVINGWGARECGVALPGCIEMASERLADDLREPAAIWGARWS